jgi:hypothetical protein
MTNTTKAGMFPVFQGDFALTLRTCGCGCKVVAAGYGGNAA